MNYWINSNSGDYVSLSSSGVYSLHLIPRWSDDGESLKYEKYEIIEITPVQFESLVGFIPIKQKNLFRRKEKKYGPTLSDGTKGNSVRVNVPSKSEVREKILKQLGL